MRMIPNEPIEPTAAVFDALREKFIGLVPTLDAEQAEGLWTQIMAAVSDDCRQWFRLGEASGECDAYDRGKHAGEQEAWDAIGAFLEAAGPACIAGTALDPRRAS